MSLITDGSLAALGRRAGVDGVDGRRFRMTLELSGAGEHDEDGWIGSEVGVGEARVRVTGPVGRCVVTTRNPDTGVSDLDTLRVLGGYGTLRRANRSAAASAATSSRRASSGWATPSLQGAEPGDGGIGAGVDP